MTLLATWPIVIMRGSGDIKEKTFGREAFNEEREGEDKRMMLHTKTQKNKGGILAFPTLKRSPLPLLTSMMMRGEWGVLEMMICKERIK